MRYNIYIYIFIFIFIFIYIYIYIVHEQVIAILHKQQFSAAFNNLSVWGGGGGA